MNPAIVNAVARLKAGEDPQAVLEFIYALGFSEGMLKMAGVAETEMMKILEAA